MCYVVRSATSADLPAVAAIYNHEVEHEISTFDLEPVGTEVWSARLASTQRGDHLLVAVNAGDQVIGYAHAASYRPRPGYRRTRETSIYLAEEARGLGIGRLLYDDLLERLIADGMHTVVALIALPNPASVALHEKLGFRHVGTLTEVGYKFGRWIDTAWFEKRLDSFGGRGQQTRWVRRIK
jgi:L-amino acid N-acyltransferase YncA